MIRLAWYLAVAGSLYLLSRATADVLHHQLRPATWFQLSEANLVTASISLIVVAIRWVNTLGERAPG